MTFLKGAEITTIEKITKGVGKLQKFEMLLYDYNRVYKKLFTPKKNKIDIQLNTRGGENYVR